MAEALDLKTVVEAFRIMGEYLRDRNTLGEVVVYVGSAIMLQFKWRSSTRDVDALITSVGNHGMVQFAADEAARRLALPSSWLSESVAMYTSRSETDTDRIPFGVYPSYERPGLRVLSARAEYVLAMKVMALERSTFDDRDFQDAIRLGVETNTESVTDLEQLVRGYYGDQGVPAAVLARLDELASAIVAAKQAGPRR